jgi:hypothetical protein
MNLIVGIIIIIFLAPIAVFLVNLVFPRDGFYKFLLEHWDELSLEEQTHIFQIINKYKKED